MKYDDNNNDGSNYSLQNQLWNTMVTMMIISSIMWLEE